MRILFQLSANIHVILHLTVKFNHVTFIYYFTIKKSIGQYSTKYKDKYLPLIEGKFALLHIKVF